MHTCTLVKQAHLHAFFPNPPDSTPPCFSTGHRRARMVTDPATRSQHVHGMPTSSVHAICVLGMAKDVWYATARCAHAYAILERAWPRWVGQRTCSRGRCFLRRGTALPRRGRWRVDGRKKGGRKRREGWGKGCGRAAA
eukprot:1128754-Rhodomonas_salina.1